MHGGAVSLFLSSNCNLRCLLVCRLLCLFVSRCFYCSWRLSVQNVGKHVLSFVVYSSMFALVCLSFSVCFVFSSPLTMDQLGNPSTFNNMGHIFRTIETDMQEGQAFLFFFFLVMVHTTISYSALVLALVVVNSKSSSTTNNSNQLTNQLPPLRILLFFFCLPFPPFSHACLSVRLHVATCCSSFPSFHPLAHFRTLRPPITCQCTSRATQLTTPSWSRPHPVDSCVFSVALLDSIDPVIIVCRDQDYVSWIFCTFFICFDVAIYTLSVMISWTSPSRLLSPLLSALLLFDPNSFLFGLH